MGFWLQNILGFLYMSVALRHVIMRFTLTVYNTRSLFLSKSYKTFVQFGVLLGEKYNWKINLFGVMPLWMTNIVQCWMHYIFFFILDFVISKVEGHWSAPMLLTLWLWFSQKTPEFMLAPSTYIVATKMRCL